MKSSHKVQSERAVVERVIAHLKNFKIMFTNKVSTAEKFEKTLDNVIALHNFHFLLKLDGNFDLPGRRAAILGEHIFHPSVSKEDVDLKIPVDGPDLMLPKYKHIRDFKEFLPSAAKAISDSLKRGGNACIFFPTVLERGKNLYNGAYVLQLQVMPEGLDSWTVKYVVGASYSYETHTGYFKLSRDGISDHHICDCFSG